MDMNKMTAKHMADAYHVVRRRIGRWSTSEREKCEALLSLQRYKDYIISWRTYISHIRYIHPFVHTNLNQKKNTRVTHVNIIYINKQHKTHTLDNPSTCRDNLSYSYLSVQPNIFMYSHDDLPSSLINSLRITAQHSSP